MEKLYIGISGVGRSGKDTAAKLLASELESLGYRCAILALAKPLKDQLDDFCYENFGISTFTERDDHKKIIRDLLVGYGSAKRKLSRGRYFVELADARIENIDADIFIISDIRYDEYEHDEVYWLKNEHNGVLVHVSRFYFDEITEKDNGEWQGLNGRSFIQPANSHELENNCKLEEKADFKFSWPNFEKDHESKCLPYVEKIIQWLIDNRKISLKYSPV